MALTIQDLQPKDFSIKVQGVELTCKPPRLSHVLILSKVGEVFENRKDATRQSIVQSQQDFDWVVEQLIPELKGIELDMTSSLDVIQQIMDKVTPEENNQLQESGVKFDTDPKVEKIG